MVLSIARRLVRHWIHVMLQLLGAWTGDSGPEVDPALLS